MSIRLLEHLRDELIKSGIVQNTPEFCESWLGRSVGNVQLCIEIDAHMRIGTPHFEKSCPDYKIGSFTMLNTVF